MCQRLGNPFFFRTEFPYAKKLVLFVPYTTIVGGGYGMKEDLTRVFTHLIDVCPNLEELIALSETDDVPEEDREKCFNVLSGFHEYMFPRLPHETKVVVRIAISLSVSGGSYYVSDRQS